jgi:flagellar FliJ protein
MKKFSFPLEKVLDYKNQMLDNLQNEYAAIRMELDAAEKKLSELNAMYEATNMKLREVYRDDITAPEVTAYKRYLNDLNRAVQDYEQKKAGIQEKLLKKQREIINAKTEVSIYEKLKEKELLQYNQTLAKENELFVEEILNNNRSVARF